MPSSRPSRVRCWSSQSQHGGRRCAPCTTRSRRKLTSSARITRQQLQPGTLTRSCRCSRTERRWSDPARPSGKRWLQPRRGCHFHGASIHIRPIEVVRLTEEWGYEFGAATTTYTPWSSEEVTRLHDTYLLLLRNTGDGWKAYREVASSSPPPGGCWPGWVLVDRERATPSTAVSWTSPRRLLTEHLRPRRACRPPGLSSVVYMPHPCGVATPQSCGLIQVSIRDVPAVGDTGRYRCHASTASFGAGEHARRSPTRGSWHYVPMLEKQGRGWVYELEGRSSVSLWRITAVGTSGRYSSTLPSKATVSAGHCTMRW